VKATASATASLPPPMAATWASSISTGRCRPMRSLGSGFVIDPSGIIVTNYHVIEGADEITANFTDGSKLPATLVGHDPKTDLALIKVESETELTAVSFGDSNAIRVGDWVMAIGNPFGLGGTLDARHRFGAQPQHPVRPLRRFHPDRRLDQSRQLGRPAVQHGRPGHRREHGDHFADRRVDRNRFRGAVANRHQRDRTAARIRRDAPRLARRASSR
jgi:hypothetical protein